MLRRSLPWLLMVALAAPAGAGSRVKRDEEVLLLPTSGALVEEGSAWQVPVHAWVFEREHDSLWRSALMGELLEALELGTAAGQRALFRERAWLFLADNEGGKVVRVVVAGREHRLEPTGPDGHARDELLVNRGLVRALEDEGWLELAVRLGAGDPRSFSVQTQLVPPQGVSVISDIDDTIKISEVLDRPRLVANTFLRDYRAVPGMAALYEGWAADGAVFHYLSASPWQLYPPLAEFLDQECFPRGSFHLRTLRLKDGSFADLLESPAPYKTATIEALLSAYPMRRFILVGDSAEHDPEIYAAIARDHPEQVVQVLIREVTDDAGRILQIEELFVELPSITCTTFREASQLGSLPMTEFPGS